MIPKKLGHIWIGPQPAPQAWLETWKHAHPEWEYQLFDNAYLLGRRWRTQHLIHEYFRRRMYPGVSDLMRYEILLEQGGFLPEADSVCLAACDELFTKPTAFTVYERENGQYGFISPILASVPQHPFLEQIVTELEHLNPSELNRPWNSVGNGFLKRIRRRLKPDITVFPSHFFIPTSKEGVRYRGDDKIYADQFWGSTKRAYPHSKGRGPLSQKEVDERHETILGQLSS